MSWTEAFPQVALCLHVLEHTGILSCTYITPLLCHKFQYIFYMLFWTADIEGERDDGEEWCRRKKTMIYNKGMWLDFNPDLQYMASTTTNSTTRMAKFFFTVMSSLPRYYPPLLTPPSYPDWAPPPGSFNTGPPPHDFPSQKLLL